MFPMQPKAQSNLEDSNNLGSSDAVEATGCANENDAVLLCYSETKDWRKCKEALAAFRECMKLNASHSQKAE
jgi:cytochrome c oxidase assembly factor 4